MTLFVSNSRFKYPVLLLYIHTQTSRIIRKYRLKDTNDTDTIVSKFAKNGVRILKLLHCSLFVNHHTGSNLYIPVRCIHTYNKSMVTIGTSNKEFPITVVSVSSFATAIAKID